MRKKVVYFQDAQKDDFAGFKDKEIKIDENFKYINANWFYKILSFVVNRIIMVPFCFLYGKIKFGFNIKNKHVLKPFRKQGYFMYGNHTLLFGDAFFPHFITAPKKPYIIVNKQNVAKAKTLVMMNGALPLPDTIGATKNFLKAIKTHNQNGSPIIIYPEAKIWPYYTKIRNFDEKSFCYPVDYNSPIFCFTTTYTSRRFRKIPKVTIWIDGPFFTDNTKTKQEKKLDLRNQVYNTMNKRSQNSNYEYIEYVKKEGEDDSHLNGR